MSHITEALNKAQELRQDHRGQKKAGDFKPQPISRMLVISIIVTGAIVAFFINVVIIMFVIRSTKLNQKKIYNLEEIVPLMLDFNFTALNQLGIQQKVAVMDISNIIR